MRSQFLSVRFPRWILILSAVSALSFDTPAFSADPIVTAISFQSSSVRVGGSFTATFSGTGFSDQTYFDVRVVSPAGDDEVVFNWQRGASTSHSDFGMPPGAIFQSIAVDPVNSEIV